MAGPTVVNIAAYQNQAFGTSLVLVLPGSLVAGNVLIGAVFNGNAITWPAGWTPIDSYAVTNFFGSYAYHVVVGGETNPTVTWTGNNSADGVILQVTGNDTSGPIGATTKQNDSGGTTSTFLGGGLVTTRANSLVLDIEMDNQPTLATPAGYSAVSGPSNHMLFASIAEAASGSTTTAISYALGNAGFWMDFQVEILAAPILAATMNVGLTMAVAIAPPWGAIMPLGLSQSVSLSLFVLKTISLTPFLVGMTQFVRENSEILLPNVNFGLGISLTRWQITKQWNLTANCALGFLQTIPLFGTTKVIPAVSMALGMTENSPLITGATVKQPHTVIDMGT